MKRVHCLGVIVVDALSKPIAHYPIPGKVTQVNTESLRFMVGGGAANSGAALGQMGVPVGVFSKVGSDPNGDFVVDSLRRHGVSTDGIRVSDSDVTPFTYVGIHPDGDRTFIHTPGANKTLGPDDIDPEALLGCDLLFYQDLWGMPCLDGGPGADLLAEARRRGVVTLLDECYGFGPDPDAWDVMLPHADYVLPSVDDMRFVYPDRRPEQVIDLLHDKGAGCVVLKMGRDGCLVSADGRLTRLESQVSEIVDTTGAGDCFDAGFVAGLAQGLAPVDAAGVGSLAAAACIRHMGGAAGIPSLDSLLHAWEKNTGNRQ